MLPGCLGVQIFWSRPQKIRVNFWTRWTPELRGTWQHSNWFVVKNNKIITITIFWPRPQEVQTNFWIRWTFPTLGNWKVLRITCLKMKGIEVRLPKKWKVLRFACLPWASTVSTEFRSSLSSKFILNFLWPGTKYYDFCDFVIFNNTSIGMLSGSAKFRSSLSSKVHLNFWSQPPTYFVILWFFDFIVKSSRPLAFPDFPDFPDLRRRTLDSQSQGSL